MSAEMTSLEREDGRDKVKKGAESSGFEDEVRFARASNSAIQRGSDTGVWAWRGCDGLLSK